MSLVRNNDRIPNQLLTSFISHPVMVKSKPKEVTPYGTVHLVKWVQKQTTWGRKGRWVTDKCTNPRQSVQSSLTKSPIKQAAGSPTKSPTKQPWDDLMEGYSGDFDRNGINPFRLPQGQRRCKKRMMSNISSPYMRMAHLAHCPKSRVQTSIFGSGNLGRRIILTSF
jgi:hypothetical protein